MTTNLISPMAWIANRTGSITPLRPPMIYLAHPVAAQPGEVLAVCKECGASNTFAPGDAVDLRLVCDHDAPVEQVKDPARIVAFNCARALRWWQWFHVGIPQVVWVMSWYVNVTANGEADPMLIEQGLRDDCEVVRRCDALMACGPRISSGMRRESLAGVEVGLELFQVEGYAKEPPRINAPAAVPWRTWAPS